MLKKYWICCTPETNIILSDNYNSFFKCPEMVVLDTDFHHHLPNFLGEPFQDWDSGNLQGDFIHIREDLSSFTTMLEINIPAVLFCA